MDRSRSSAGTPRRSSSGRERDPRLASLVPAVLDRPAEDDRRRGDEEDDPPGEDRAGVPLVPGPAPRRDPADDDQDPLDRQDRGVRGEPDRRMDEGAAGDVERVEEGRGQEDDPGVDEPRREVPGADPPDRADEHERDQDDRADHDHEVAERRREAVEAAGEDRSQALVEEAPEAGLGRDRVPLADRPDPQRGAAASSSGRSIRRPTAGGPTTAPSRGGRGPGNPRPRRTRSGRRSSTWTQLPEPCRRRHQRIRSPSQTRPIAAPRKTPSFRPRDASPASRPANA